LTKQENIKEQEAKPIEPPPLELKVVDTSHIDDIIRITWRLFYESNFVDVLTPSETVFRENLYHAIPRHLYQGVIAYEGTEPIGYILWSVERVYTEEPMALLFMLYVIPERRRSPLGRILVDTAEKISMDMGAKVFYAGAMAGIPKQDRMLGNMFRKLGYEEMAFWGRKVLVPEEEDTGES